MSPAEPLSALARLSLAAYLPGEFDTRTDRHGTYRRGRCAGCRTLLGETDWSTVRWVTGPGPGGLWCRTCAPERRAVPREAERGSPHDTDVHGRPDGPSLAGDSG